jgi:spore maturation protein CgeB
MRIVVLGLSITSSWGNGHATNYRALLEALRRRGHDVLFLERDAPWYSSTRDWSAPYVLLYGSVDELRERWPAAVRGADLVLVGSFVPDGVAVGEWVCDMADGVTAFWDIDTPVTVAKLESGDDEYLTPDLARRYDLYLSFTGGPLLERVRARDARPFWCMVDAYAYRPAQVETRWDLGYLGTYAPDRQPVVDALLLETARALGEQRFVLAGPQYPDEIEWPVNVERIEHLEPSAHPAFYSSQRFTLNATRAQMVQAGCSPSVRLFEAAACGVPIVSDWWPGLDAFFEPGHEILVAGGTDDAVRCVRDLPDAERRAIGERARRRVLAAHTADHRARELERHVQSVARPAGSAVA